MFADDPPWRAKPAEDPTPPKFKATEEQEVYSAPKTVEPLTNQRPLASASPKEGAPEQAPP